MVEDLIVIIIIFFGFVLYCNVLDKLGLRERTKQIAIIILGVIVGGGSVFYIVVASGRGYFFRWIFVLWVCMGLASAVLKLLNKEQLAKRLQKLNNIIYLFVWIFIIVEAIL